MYDPHAPKNWNLVIFILASVGLMYLFLLFSHGDLIKKNEMLQENIEDLSEENARLNIELLRAKKLMP